MDLAQIECFIAVAREGSFRAAAEALGVAQSQISRSIAALENSLTIRLVDRSTRKLKLTPAGELLLEEMKQTLGSVARTKQAATSWRRGEAGELEIGTPSSMPFLSIFSEIVRSYRRKWPAVQLSVRELSTAEQVNNLLNHTIDIGFARLPIPCASRGLSITPLMTEPLVIALPSSHRLSNLKVIPIREIETERIIGYMPGQGGLFDVVEHIFLTAGINPIITHRAFRVPLAVSFVAAEFGIALVPSAVMDLPIKGVTYRPISGVACSSSIALVTRADDRSPAVRNFVSTGLSWRK